MSLTATAALAAALGPREARAERIRLLKFVTIFAIGGTERQVATLAERLDHSRFDLHLACLKRSGELLPGMERLGHGVVGYDIPNLYGRRALRERRRLAGDLRRHRIEIVHTYSFYPNVFAIPAARLARVPVIMASIRDTGAYLTPIQLRVQRVICRFADCIVANADAVRQWLMAQGYDGDKITIIRNGVDLAAFGRSMDGRRLRHELGLAPQAPVVAVVSRLSRIKGLEYFLAAAAAVATTHPDARFLIVGEGSFQERNYQRELEACAARLGVRDRVTFTGLRHDVPDILSEAAISVLPSLSEGLSNTLLESMAAGVPVIATRVGGNPEAVDEGVTGLLVPPRDSAALARAIRRLLEDRELAMRLGRAARRRATEHFSLESMVRATERLYVALLDAKGRRQPDRPCPDLLPGRGAF
jgi:glycosyltransferase involved in cell wall biosynthesis